MRPNPSIEGRFPAYGLQAPLMSNVRPHVIGVALQTVR